MSPTLGLALLITSVTAAEHGTQPAFDKVLQAWGPTVVDVRQGRQLSPEDRASLEALGEEYAEAGLELHVTLVDAVGVGFSIGDLTSQLRSARDCTPDCVYLSAHGQNLHSSTSWYTYKEARAASVALLGDYRKAPIPTLVRYGRLLLEEGRRRTRHRRLMLAVAGAAVCGLAVVLARARLRQAPQPARA